jgi:hypothetical protein
VTRRRVWLLKIGVAAAAFAALVVFEALCARFGPTLTIGTRVAVYVVVAMLMILLVLSEGAAWVLAVDAISRRLARRPSFASHDELFRALDELLARLERDGHHDAVTELKHGLSGLNGLTDGWAFFLNSIDRVYAAGTKRFARDDRGTLATIRSAVRRIVYRRG